MDSDKTWWEVHALHVHVRQHEESEMLKSIYSDINHGRHGSHLELIQTSSFPTLYTLSPTYLYYETVSVCFKYVRFDAYRKQESTAAYQRCV